MRSTGTAALMLALAIVAAGQEVQHTASVECSLCHSRLGENNQLGQFTLWKDSVMAHAGRDPYWRAKVDSEIKHNPKHAALIDEKCHRCHTPQGKAMARDGAGCSACHLMSDEGLGTPASFTGGFKFNSKKESYGPHRDPFPNPMIMHVGLMPAYGGHTVKSELCATCHTVITPTLDAKGDVRGEFVEQAPYLEWKASSFAEGGTTCQSCHVPAVKDPPRRHIAHRPPGGPFPPTSPREPFGRHLFAGANIALPALLEPANRAMGERAREMLGTAAMLTVEGEGRANSIEAKVTLMNLTGHKLPTGFPSRRVWISFEVRGEDNRIFFASGPPPPVAQPHHQVIDKQGQVQVYEAEMKDISGRPTTALMRAAGYAKDNRILPAGFVPSSSDGRILPVGTGGDRDFEAGSDTTLYRVADVKPGRYKIRVRAMYESVKPDHAAELPEALIRRLKAVEAAVMAEAEAEVEVKQR